MFHLPHWLLHRTKYRFQDQVNLIPFAYLWTMRRTAPVGSTAYQWPCDGSANIQYCGLVLISSWYRLHIHMQLSQLFFKKRILHVMNLLHFVTDKSIETGHKNTAHQSKTSSSCADIRRDSPWCKVKKQSGFSPFCSKASLSRRGGSR